MTTEKQRQANRANALKSTGPVSPAGKLKVSANRISHGILSTRFLLKEECPEEYDELLQQLFRQLTPVGALEQGLVEKIAMAFWRLRRLARAESGAIELAASPKRLKKEVEMGLARSGARGPELSEDDLREITPEENEQLQWCRAVLGESDSAHGATLDTLKQQAPLIFAQLQEDAGSLGVELYCKQEVGLKEFIAELVGWCKDEVFRLEKRQASYPLVAAKMESARDFLSIAWEKSDLFHRYHSALDNQLYKAMKALREAQEWRMNHIEVTLSPASGES